MVIPPLPLRRIIAVFFRQLIGDMMQRCRKHMGKSAVFRKPRRDISYLCPPQQLIDHRPPSVFLQTTYPYAVIIRYIVNGKRYSIFCIFGNNLPIIHWNVPLCPKKFIKNHQNTRSKKNPVIYHS